MRFSGTSRSCLSRFLRFSYTWFRPLTMSDDRTPPRDPDTEVSSDADDDTAAEQPQEDLSELLEELRAEITHLKAEEARARAQSWIQRHPLFAAAVSMGIGAAAGYGVSEAFRSRPPRTLPERARWRLSRLGGDAQEFASRLGDRLKQRAARSGTQLRKRVEETGRRLSKETQQVGEQARRGAQEMAGQASDQAQSLGENASERLSEATEKAARHVQKRREEAADEARELGEKLGETASTAVEDVTGGDSPEEDGRSVARSLFTLAGLAAGGYLASKVRQWL